MSGDFPKFNEPATRGDVLVAMIYTRSLVMAVKSATAALARGDSAAAYKCLTEDWEKAWKEFDGAVEFAAGNTTDLPNGN